MKSRLNLTVRYLILGFCIHGARLLLPLHAAQMGSSQSTDTSFHAWPVEAASADNLGLSLRALVVKRTAMEIASGAASNVKTTAPVRRFPSEVARSIASSISAPAISVPGVATGAPPAAIPSILIQSVSVISDFTGANLQPDHFTGFVSSASEVDAMPGAYSDVPRYVQTMPGVAADSDARNSYMVRGGNPVENLFVINGFEVPNINQLSTLTSTAGFASMIDTNTLDNVVLHTGGWSSAFSDRLSSVLEMNTLGHPKGKQHNSVDLGLGGVGLITNRSLGDSGSAMVSARRSILNYFTDDIGIDGVPVYQSALASFTRPVSAHDSISGLVLGGMDSIVIRPSLSDWEDPFPFSHNSHSNRYNVGLQWHHSLASHGLGSISFTQANEHATKSEAWAIPEYLGNSASPAQGTPVYADNLTNRISTIRHDLLYISPHRMSMQLGGSFAANRIDYRVNQYSGYPNSYVVQYVPMNPLNVQLAPLATEQGYYAEVVAQPHRSLEVTAGARYQRWGLNQSQVLTPHAGITWSAGERLTLFANASITSQLPPYLYLLVEPRNIQLKPIVSHVAQFGASQRIAGLKLDLTFYSKTYRDYPVATEYPALSLANVIDTFAQPFLWFPMTSQGDGKGLGAELSVSSNVARRLYFRISASESSMKYRALDGIWRVGNYDYPFLGTAVGGWRIGKRTLATARYSLHTGAPYTPFLVQESNQQDRPIYDLTQVNALRGPMYERLDMRLEHTFRIRNSEVKVYGGGDNVLDRANFYQWIMCPQYPKLKREPYMLTQMGFYPEGGVTWRF